MKQKIYTLSAFILIAGSLSAQNAGVAPTDSGISFTSILVAVNAILLLFVIFLLATLANSVQKMRNASDGKEVVTWWEKFAALKSEKSEDELILEEDFDGISELDNPTPPWYNFIFYLTIVSAIIYFLNYHVFKYSKLQDAEYTEEVTNSKIAVEAYLKKSGNLIDENTVTLLTDKKVLEATALVFKEKCVVCHGEKAEGKVGPNLTDEYWINGGDIKSVFKTIKYGVPAKGMISWQNTFNGKQMQELASYVKSLKGTNPPNPKAPQGDVFKEDTTSVQAKVDTVAAVKATTMK